MEGGKIRMMRCRVAEEAAVAGSCFLCFLTVRVAAAALTTTFANAFFAFGSLEIRPGAGILAMHSSRSSGVYVLLWLKCCWLCAAQCRPSWQSLMSLETNLLKSLCCTGLQLQRYTHIIYGFEMFCFKMLNRPVFRMSGFQTSGCKMAGFKNVQYLREKNKKITKKYRTNTSRRHSGNLGGHYLVKVFTCKEQKKLWRNTEHKHYEDILVDLGGQRNTERKDYKVILGGLRGQGVHYLMKLITRMSLTKFSQIFTHTYI